MKVQGKRGRKPIPMDVLNTQKVKALVGHQCRVYARGCHLIIEINYGKGMTPEEIKTTETWMKLTQPARGRGRPKQVKPVLHYIPVLPRKRGRPAGSISHKVSQKKLPEYRGFAPYSIY
jgi:hypothetical protein